ncbi:MAG: ATP-binding protein [Terasakiella sp.]|uniref:ATP-binding protein n=1 Tax=unclassified Terasakiella TaxID=2614952 RepID=UPI003B00F093
MGELVTLVVTENIGFREDIISSLSNDPIKLTFASSFNDAEDILQDKKNKISTIICDVPGEDCNFETSLRIFKRKEFAKYVPVIGIAPFASSKNKISRQLFFHLISAPVHEQILAHTIEAGNSDFKRYQALLNEVQSRTSAIGLIQSGTFTLKTLQQAEALTTMLSLACPDPSSVALGLSELLVNAIEHGNLEISYSQKSQLLERGQWDAEIRTRLEQDKYKDRFVEIQFSRTPDTIEIIIEDQGDGFDWKKYMQCDPGKFNNKHGRGIALVIAMGFTKLEYNEKGNRVKAIVEL